MADSNGFPREFGKYQLLNKISQGGMAEVFLAVSETLEGIRKRLAIKKILPELHQKDFITKFLDEARLSLHLSHKNIVQVFDVGEVGGEYYLAMEFIDGMDLRKMQWECDRRNITVPLSIVLYIINEICEGLAYAHRLIDENGHPLQLIHRDISPQNILISRHGEVKIMDFGIAKAASNVSMTREGIVLGKIGYMSPEQARGDQIDQRSDIFAVGILFHELLTGTKLYQSDSQVSLLKTVSYPSIKPPQRPEEKIPGDINAIVMKSLEVQTKRRYQSIDEMLEDLHNSISFRELITSTSVMKRFVAMMEQQKADGIHEMLKGERCSDSYQPTTASESYSVARLKEQQKETTYNSSFSSSSISFTDFLKMKGFSRRKLLATGIAATLLIVTVVSLIFLLPVDQKAGSRNDLDDKNKTDVVGNTESTTTSSQKINAFEAIDLKDEFKKQAHKLGEEKENTLDGVKEAPQNKLEKPPGKNLKIIKADDQKRALHKSNLNKTRARVSKIKERQKRRNVAVLKTNNHQKENISSLYKKNMRKVIRVFKHRGIIKGDDRQLDNLWARCMLLGRNKKYQQAVEYSQKTIEYARAIQIDRNFVWKKMNRLNEQRKIRQLSTNQAKKFDALTKKIMQFLVQKKFDLMNRELNRGFESLK